MTIIERFKYYLSFEKKLKMKDSYITLSNIDNLISSILETDICLIGEEDHWLANILEKEKLIFDKMVLTEPNKKYIITVEYDLNTTYPKIMDYCNDYLNKMKEIFGKGLRSISFKNGLRGLKMAKKIYNIYKTERDSKLIAVVGTGHISSSGNEIPVLLKKMLEDNGLYKRFTRIYLKRDTTLKNRILLGNDIFGFFYLF